MRNLRLLLLMAMIPFAPAIADRVVVMLSGVDRVISRYRLSAEDRAVRCATECLASLHQPAGDPQAGDWRATVVEPGQSLAQYALSDPIRPTAGRNVIYVQPLGDFAPAERQIVELSAEFLELYFCCPVTLLPDAGEAVVPPEARRIHAVTREEQFLAPWITTDFLKPQLPDDALALIALTTGDLWPGENWNFVFGQASLSDRVGVWSMARLGDPEIGEDHFRECLRRTLKTATHETGHMFSMKHCIFFECNMSGSGSLEEGDRYPLSLCPDCLAKLHWSTRTEPVDRLKALAQFCERNGLVQDLAYYRNAAARLTGTDAAGQD
ncbi:MAG: archaemetzincin [Planctomycetaceae bacterium]